MVYKQLPGIHGELQGGDFRLVFGQISRRCFGQKSITNELSRASRGGILKEFLGIPKEFLRIPKKFLGIPRNYLGILTNSYEFLRIPKNS